MNESISEEERYCTVEESIEQSLKEIQLMTDGKLPKISIEEAMNRWQEWVINHTPKGVGFLWLNSVIIW